MAKGMPLVHDSSIVPDSTLSSSPAPTTPAVHRVTRTYGRQRPSVSIDDLDNARLATSSSSEPRDMIYRTAPREIDEEIPPSSDPVTSPDDDEVDGASADAPPRFEFSWRRQLKEMETEDDFDVNSDALGSQVDVSTSGERNVPASLVNDDSSTLVEDILRESLDPLTSSQSSEPVSRSDSPSPSSAGALPKRSRKQVARFIRDSDSDGEGNDGESAGLASRIVTSRKQPSPTPSASDNEASKMSPARNTNTRKKGKVPINSHSSLSSSNSVDDPFQSPKPSLRNAKAGKHKRKIKAPSKKELVETARSRARIAVDQEASVPRLEGTTQKYTLQSFLECVILGSGATSPGHLDRDPIVDFSSDGLASTQNISFPVPAKCDDLPDRHPALLSASHLKSPSMVPGLIEGMNDRDTVPPAAHNDKQEREKEKQQRDLLELKRRVLAAQSLKSRSQSDDEDDLKIVSVPSAEMRIRQEEVERKSGRKKWVAQNRQKVLQFTGVTMRTKESPVKGNDLQKLKDISYSRTGRKSGGLTTQELNQLMMKNVEKEKIQVIRAKETRWKELGGTLGTSLEATSLNIHHATKSYAQKGLEVIGERQSGEHTDESDEDWEPADNLGHGQDNDSGSGDSRNGDGGNESDDDATEGDVDVTIVYEETDIVSEDDLSSQQPMKKPFRRTKGKMLVESDSESENSSPSRTLVPTTPRLPASADDLSNNDEGKSLLPQQSGLMLRGSLSSIDERTEDEGDKENDTSIMWDRGENKENTVIRGNGDRDVGSPPGSATDPYCASQSMPTTSPTGMACDEENDNRGRQPFKDLLDDDPFASQAGPSRPPISPFMARLHATSPMAAQSLSEHPSIVSFDSGKGLPFSQFELSQEPKIFEAGLQPGFESDPENAVGAGKPGGLFGLAKLLKDSVNSPAARKLPLTQGLGLTQDISLQPAFQVGSNLMQKADQIFEKEQEYIFDAATKPPKDADLYVNEHGFLTQTRPNIGSPEVYKMPSTQNSFPASEFCSSERRPLRTISFAEFEPDSGGPRQRLHKRAATPPSPLTRPTRGIALPPSPMLPKRSVKNAFEVLGKSKSDEPRPKLQVSEFVEDEAQESDDDEMLGFGLKKKKDDEEGEDLDKNLEGMVDDREIGEKEMGTDLVLEKFQEQVEKDDQEIEKLHQAAVHGELRKKKRGLIGLDDDDDSDDDGADSRRRSNMYKKPRINRDNIKELGADPATKSFFDIYEQELGCENTEFSYLADSQLQEEVMIKTEDMEPRGQDEHDGSNFMTYDDIRREVREIPQKDKDDAFDPHDVTWVDEEANDEDNDHVKLRKHDMNRARSRIQDQMDVNLGTPGPSRKPAGLELDRLQSWAKAEGRRMQGTTGRAVGGAAVTGLAVKAGVGTARSGGSNTSSKTSGPHREVKAQKSFLASVAAERRNTRFG